MNNPDFVPTLAELLKQIEANPYQFPAKHDELAGARAADLAYRGKTWRLVYDVDAYTLEVLVLAIDEHDAAYRNAAARR